ncbi:bacterial regulatory helix-turn-helix s, AraC family protein, partial [Vibrio cholerae O1 str. 116063]
GENEPPFLLEII